MEAEDKKWESGAVQQTKDKRTIEQMERAKEECDRRNENLDDKGEGSYKEKNGDENKQYTDLENEPKLDKTKSDVK